jgi:hypothetical protein
MPEGSIGIVEREKRARALREAQRKRARARAAQTPKPAARADLRSPDARQPTTTTQRRQIAEAQARNAAAHKLEKAGLHKQARQLRAGLPLTGGFTERIGSDLQSAATGFPGGAYQLGKAVALDTADVARHPTRPQYGRTAHLLGAMGKQYAHDYRHPIRYAKQHPGFVALDVSAALSAGAGTASRAGAAGRALRETGSVRAALTRAPSEGGSLLKKPLPPPREHVYQGQKIAGRYSTNPAARAVQQLHDLRTGGAIGASKASRLLGEEQRISSAAERAPALRVAAQRKHFSTPQQLAIRVVGEGKPLDDVIAAHRARAAKATGQARERLERRTAQLEAARPYLDTDADGRPVIAKGHSELTEAVRLTERAVTSREQSLIRAGMLDEGRAAARRNAPARAIDEAKHEGARREFLAQYEKAHGNVVDTDAVRALLPEWKRASKEERASRLSAELHHVASDEAKAIYEAKLARPHGEHPTVTIMGGGAGVGKTTVRKALGLEDDVIADTTLSSLKSAEAKIQQARDSGRTPEIVYVYRDPVEALREGVLDRVGETDRTVPLRVFIRSHVKSNEVIRQIAEKHPKLRIRVYRNSTAGGLHESSLAELPRLSYNETGKAVASAFQNEVTTGRVSEAVRRGVQGREVSRRSRSLQRSARGGEAARSAAGRGALEVEAVGRFRVPDVRPSKLPRSPAEWRGGVPRKPGTLTHGYTGALRESGGYTTETLRAVAEDALQAERYLAVERLRERIVPMGEKMRPADTRAAKFVPVRPRKLSKAESDKLRRVLAEADIETLTPDEAARLEAALDSFRESAFPESEFKTTPVGAEVPGVVWVDRRLLGAQRKIIGKLDLVDVPQDVMRGFVLYAKPGYVAPNMLGNAAYNLMQQGFLAPLNFARAVKLPKDVGSLVDEVMGSGISKSLAEGSTSPLTKGVHMMADFWSVFVDEPFRRASFIHEARLRGFKTHAELAELIEDPANRGLLGEVAQRSRDAIVEYERMSPIERDLVRRLLFVYPWVKGSTYYAGQFFRDHPIQAAVFAAIGQEGEHQDLEELGPLPSWARGSFKVGGSDEHPWIVNPAGISPFSTPTAVVGTALGGFRSAPQSEQLGEMLGPIPQAAIAAAYSRDTFTGRELKGGFVQNLLKQLAQGTPQYLLEERIRNRKDAGDRSYPYGVGSAVGQFVGGSATPRPANRAALNRQAEEEAGSALSAPERARERVHEEAAAVTDGLRSKPKLLRDHPELVGRVRRAYDRKAAVDAARAEARSANPHGGEEYQRAAFLAEVDVLATWGAMEADEVEKAKAWAGRHDAGDIESARRYFTEAYFTQAYLDLLHDARKAAGVKS